MDTILTLLAFAGIAAAVWHVVRAAFRFLRTRSRRGDVTSLETAKEQRDSAASEKTRAGAEAIGWVILLLAPPLTPWARHIYAAYTVLWVVPAMRRRGR